VECGLKAFDLSGMSRSEAESFLRAKADLEIRRLFRRKDGTIQTDVCPRAVRVVASGPRFSVSRRLKVAILAVVSFLGVAAMWGYSTRAICSYPSRPTPTAKSPAPTQQFLKKN
jgi:hypothetical protein